MSVATIKLVNEQNMSDFYFMAGSRQTGEDQANNARRLLKAGLYRIQGTMGVPGFEGEAAAEEVFDLTNNPCRQEEREELYGRYRSVSVGDIINVDGTDWLCASLGWIKL